MSNENPLDPNMIATCIRFEENAKRISSEIMLKAKGISWLEQDQLIEAGYRALVAHTCEIQWIEIPKELGNFYLRQGMLNALKDESMGKDPLGIADGMN